MDKIVRQPRTDQPKEYPQDMRITMAIPYKDLVHGVPGIPKYTFQRFHEMCEVTAKAGYEVFVNTDCATSNTPVTRTKIVQQFKGDWLLMMDADAFPEPDTANRMLMAAKQEPGNLNKIICAPGVRPSYPHFACFGTVRESGMMVPWRYGVEFGDDEIDATETCLKEVTGAGFHCVLIHRSVFDEVEYPWFPLNVKDPDTGIIYGHDYSFCRAAARIGVKTFVDFSLRVGHYGVMPFTLAHNRAVIKANPAEADKQRLLTSDPELMLDEDRDVDPDYVMNYNIPGRGDRVKITGDGLTTLPKEAFVDKEDQ